jgi:formamidopyrimidine-DNA glycosylase
MPELPEVETTLRGLMPHLLGRQVIQVLVRTPALRWPLPDNLAQLLCGQTILGLSRRAKYLLIAFEHGTVLLHLGMSGHLRLVPTHTPAGKHDHIDLQLNDGQQLRYNDPRRFGALLWLEQNPQTHPLLCRLGPEPFAPEMTGGYLYGLGQGRRATVKSFLMDQRVVVGVGNIYASEALFRAGIHPQRPAGRISKARFDALAAAIREVLSAAIAAGGTTLRDFSNAAGRPGYFSQQLRVYGRSGQPCPNCGAPLSQQRIAQRASYFCGHCQH